jgi:hypothetical protein
LNSSLIFNHFLSRF